MIIFENDDTYYVVKLPLILAKLEGLRQAGLLMNKGLWGAFKLNKMTQMLEPIDVWIYIFNPIQFKRTGFETIIEVKSKSLAIRKANELNDKDYTKESLITKIKNWLKRIFSK